MREIIFNMSFITLLFGCNQSENYLENHKVFPCSPEIVQEKKYRIIHIAHMINRLYI